MQLRVLVCVFQDVEPRGNLLEHVVDDGYGKQNTSAGSDGSEEVSEHRQHADTAPRARRQHRWSKKEMLSSLVQKHFVYLTKIPRNR